MCYVLAIEKQILRHDTNLPLLGIDVTVGLSAQKAKPVGTNAHHITVFLVRSIAEIKP